MIPYSHLKSHLNQLVKSIFQKHNQKLGRNFDLLSNCKTFIWVTRALDAEYLVLSPLPREYIQTERTQFVSVCIFSEHRFIYGYIYKILSFLKVNNGSVLKNDPSKQICSLIKGSKSLNVGKNLLISLRPLHLEPDFTKSRQSQALKKLVLFQVRQYNVTGDPHIS